MLDSKLFYLINHGCSNFVFDRLLPLVTFLGSSKFVLALSVLVLIIFYRSKKMPGILLLTGFAISSGITYFLKGFFSRPRPFVALKDVHVLVREADKMHSLPSGHAVFSFMAAVILASYFKRGYIFFIFAIAISFSRVYVGVHYPSDVIAGAALGSAIGLALVRVAKKIERK